MDARVALVCVLKLIVSHDIFKFILAIAGLAGKGSRKKGASWTMNLTHLYWLAYFHCTFIVNSFAFNIPLSLLTDYCQYPVYSTIVHKAIWKNISC
jgi:hypothetical protein